MRLRPVASFLPCFGAAALLSLALGAGSTPAFAQVTSAFDLSRSTSAQADAVQRNAAVAGFGNWTSNLQVASLPEPAHADGAASQSSGLYDDYASAAGEAHAKASGGGHGAYGESNYEVHFLVRARSGYTLTGHVEVSTLAVGAPPLDAPSIEEIVNEGQATGSIAFSGPGGEVGSLRLDCRTNPEQPDACTQADDLLASGVLEPGVYVLQARAYARGQGSGAEPVGGVGLARYSFEIRFDGPIVNTEAVTWGGLKSLYR